MTIPEFAKELKKEKDIAIFCHVRPDGDTFGSALGLQCALLDSGITADVFCDDVIPARFGFLPEIKRVKNQLERGYGAYLAIDCADEMRTGGFAGIFKTEKNTYNFDHHISNTKYAKYNVMQDCSACAEIVVELIKCMGLDISERCANLLAMGILTDSGNFRHKNVTENTFYVAGLLKEKGADFNALAYHNFTKQTKERAKLFGETMSKIRYLLDDRLAIIVVTEEMLKRTGAKPEETEGFVDFVMGIESVEVGICIMQIEKGYKASFRSKRADVSAVAGQFGGGGHVLASGCKYGCDLEEFIDKIRYYVSQQLID